MFLCPPFLVVISTAFLIVQLTGVGRHRTTTHVRVSGLSLLFLIWPRSPMSGGISILRRLPSFLVDLIWCPYAWLSWVSSSDIHPCPFSDHCAISIVFSIPEAAQPGPGVWKLNTSILDDDKYVYLISTFWGRWRQAQGSYPSNPVLRVSPSHTASKRLRELLLLVIS